MEKPKPKETTSEEGKTVHYSVGALIKNKNGEILLIERGTAPFGFAGIAGHVDEGETFEQALFREVREETGLSVISHRLLGHEFIPWNWCNRKITGHIWEVFECEASGILDRSLRETKSVGWYAPAKIKGLILEEAWDFWFRKLNLL